MRGDWRQDFYAKSLALVGLGVLAGIGALVDYWPAQLDMPEVAAVVARSAAPQPLAASALPSIHVQLNTSVPVARTRRPVRPAATPALSVAAVSGNLGKVTSAVPMPAAPAPSRFDVTPVVTSAVEAPPIALSELPPAVRQAATELPVLSSEVATEDSSGNFFTSAFKKTGSSIAAVGIKTGASIAGAFGLVGHFVTKLKFF